MMDNNHESFVILFCMQHSYKDGFCQFIGLFKKYKKTSFLTESKRKGVSVDGNSIIKSRSVGNYGIHILLGPKIPESIFR